ncbi:hypothetical protein SESBI_10384 [Sesbania bispinosa]|nr:hypothetical protein SESBI_14073 [Sesbania bispinosa]KAJ1426363.1 hypothetical protein SESBI_10384 [Sesbania bispinosa]
MEKYFRNTYRALQSVHAAQCKQSDDAQKLGGGASFAGKLRQGTSPLFVGVLVFAPLGL